jgi:hypothetical protein
MSFTYRAWWLLIDREQIFALCSTADGKKISKDERAALNISKGRRKHQQRRHLHQHLHLLLRYHHHMVAVVMVVSLLNVVMF